MHVKNLFLFIFWVCLSIIMMSVKNLAFVCLDYSVVLCKNYNFNGFKSLRH